MYVRIRTYILMRYLLEKNELDRMYRITTSFIGCIG